jgi:hypothetical protein
MRHRQNQIEDFLEDHAKYKIQYILRINTIQYVRVLKKSPHQIRLNWGIRESRFRSLFGNQSNF